MRFVTGAVPVLVGLYEEPERPPNAVDYIKKYLGAPVGVDIDALRAENDRLKTENRSLHSTVEELNKRVRSLWVDGCMTGGGGGVRPAAVPCLAHTTHRPPPSHPRFFLHAAIVSTLGASRVLFALRVCVWLCAVCACVWVCCARTQLEAIESET